MQIECPHCQTTYDLAEAALGAHGRQVRCARCKTVWHALPVLANAYAEEAAGGGPTDDRDDAFAAAEDIIPEIESPPTAIGDEMSDALDWAEDPPPAGRGFGRGGKAGARTKNASPLLARLRAHLPARLSAHLPHGPDFGALTRRLPRWLQLGLPGVNTILVGLCLALMVWRADIVRLMPQTAGFFETIGLGVNLRGLVFTDTNVTHESVAGKKVMVIDGAVQAVADKPVELPRLRFGVLDAHGQEIFAWTAILDQPYLRAGEKAFYKTRLATPPAGARAVLVRFLTRGDVIQAGTKPGHG